MKAVFKINIVTIVTMACILAGFVGCSSKKGHNSPVSPAKITIGVSPIIASAAIYVADEKGFFEQEELQVTLKTYTSGKDALNAVIRGRAQFCTVAETPVMFAALKGEKICICATISESNRYMKLVARKDGGISTPADLKGKKIGVTPGTNGEFFLYVILAANFLTSKDVTIVEFRPEEMADAIVKGKVDAVSTWAPYTMAIEKKLGDNAVIVGDSSLYYTMTWNIAGMQDLVKSNPQCVIKLMRAIISADNFIKEHPDEAATITARKSGIEDMTMFSSVWDLYSFDAKLDQSLILNLEDQARWMLERQNDSNRTIPNFLDYIYTEGLNAVRPEAVKLAGK